AAISVSWRPPAVSSASVRILRRRLVTKESPAAAASFMNQARLASMAIHSLGSAALKAQVSTTCVPCVFTTHTCCPARTRAALPRRARMVPSSLIAVPPSRGLAQPVAAGVVRWRRRAPAGEELGRGLPDLDGQRPADVRAVSRAGAPDGLRHVAVGTVRERGQHVEFREELDEVAGARRAGLGEVLARGGETGDLKHVEHVVDVELGE